VRVFCIYCSSCYQLIIIQYDSITLWKSCLHLSNYAHTHTHTHTHTLNSLLCSYLKHSLADLHKITQLIFYLLQAEEFTGKFPLTTNPIHHGDKLHQVFQFYLSFMRNTLAGYCMPDPYAKRKITEAVDTLMKCLKDPALPLFEMQVRRLR